MLRKKVDRNEVIELVRLKIDHSQLDSMQFVTIPYLTKLLNNKVEYNEFVQQLSLKVSREELQNVLRNRISSVTPESPTRSDAVSNDVQTKLR